MHLLSCCSLLLWYCPHHMTIVVPFKEGTVPGSQPQGEFFREQEGLCTLQDQPRENADSCATSSLCVSTKSLHSVHPPTHSFVEFQLVYNIPMLISDSTAISSRHIHSIITRRCKHTSYPGTCCTLHCSLTLSHSSSPTTPSPTHHGTAAHTHTSTVLLTPVGKPVVTPVWC